MDDEGTNLIRVWRYWDAPAALRALSHHGGDEDWVVQIPAAIAPLVDGTARWLEQIESCGTPQRIRPADGSVVLIGAHA